MAVLSDIREKSPKFIIAGAAIIFIFLIVFDWGLDISNRRGRGAEGQEELGSVNGKEIDRKAYSVMLQRSVENQKKQQNIVEIDDETERMIRSQVWSQLVDEMLIEQEMDRIGITVSDQEILDIVNGPNLPQFLVEQFTDSTGTFRRDAYLNARQDPQNKQAWIEVENMLRQSQKRQKLQSLIMATAMVSESEMKQRFIDRNETMNANFVLFDVNRFVADSEVTVTDDDLQEQYEAHAAEYQVKAQRKVKFVVFSQAASGEDSAMVEKEAKEDLELIQSGTDFITLAKEKSYIPVTEAFYKHGELTPQKELAVFSAKKGEVIGPIRDEKGIHLIKIIDQRQGAADFVRCSHILIKSIAGPDTVKSIQLARSVAAQARSGADFAALARQYSQDGSAQQGGELGWAPKDRYVKPFADAAFRARVGDIVGPVRTQFGWHVIKVTGRDRREVKIADLVLKVEASAQTIDEVYQRAQDFVVFAKDEGFEKAAENSKYLVRESPEFQKTGGIPGIGQNEALANFAFKNKLGEVSDPISIRNGLLVAKVSFIREAGVRPLEEIKTSIRALALHRKKMDKIREQVDTFYKSLTPSSDLLAAARLNPKLTAMNTGVFKSMDYIQAGIGRDPKFLGTALAMKQGDISRPVEGTRGFYIIQMVSKTPFDSVRYNLERESLGVQLLQEKRNKVLTEWVNELRDKAEIVDNRDKFYR